MSDILMVENGDGGDFLFLNGDIENDDTFYTAVYLSLFNGDAFYNIFAKYPRNNDFEESLNCIITPDNLKNIETNANAALDWMITENIAESIDTSSSSSSDKQTDVSIAITRTERSYKNFWDHLG